MKRILTLAAVATLAITLSYCSGSKKATTTTTTETTKPAVPKLTFDNNIQELFVSKCSPCHVPSKGGNKLALDNYDNAKGSIDDIISRVEMHPGDRGFMPMKRARLSDSTINVIKQWKMDGLGK